MKITYFSDSYVQVSFDGYNCMYYENIINNMEDRIVINGSINELVLDKTNQVGMGDYTFEDNCSCKDNKCTPTWIYINKNDVCNNPSGVSLAEIVYLTPDDRKAKI